VPVPEKPAGLKQAIFGYPFARLHCCPPPENNAIKLADKIIT
jgi:hypothetical protein